jgi:hypothetical protein
MMPGDPKQCRLHALHCIEMAATVKTPQLKTTFLDLSKSWVRLAESLEQNHVLTDEDDVDFKKSA